MPRNPGGSRDCTQEAGGTSVRPDTGSPCSICRDPGDPGLHSRTLGQRGPLGPDRNTADFCGCHVLLALARLCLPLCSCDSRACFSPELVPAHSSENQGPPFVPLSRRIWGNTWREASAGSREWQGGPRVVPLLLTMRSQETRVGSAPGQSSLSCGEEGALKS